MEFYKKLFVAIFSFICLFNLSLPAFSATHSFQQEILNLHGTLEIRAALYLKDPKGPPIQYLLRTKKTLYYLQFTDAPPKNLKGGEKVRIVKAREIRDLEGNKTLTLHSNDFVVVESVKTNAIPSAFGPQKTIVFLVNFQNDRSQPWTIAEVNNVVFGGVNNAYREDSYQQTTIEGITVGWFTSNLNNNLSCETIMDNIGVAAAAAATAAGIDLSPYKRRIYMFPLAPNCGFVGLGTIGTHNGQYSEAWLSGLNDVSITKHELGHNLGLWHSHSLLCSNGTSNTGDCRVIEYGDRACNMGGGNGTHLNAFQKEILGWLNFQNSPPIQTVTQSGNYTIDQLETTNNNSKALKILKQTLSNGSKEHYYIEFRTPTGIDAPLNCSNCDFLKGVLIHQGNSSDSNTSNLLDMSPADNNHETVVALLPGASFTDPLAPNGGVTIKLNSITATSANVAITFGSGPPPACTRAAPTMTISPDTTQIVSRGSALNFALTLKNNDSAACTPSVFNFYTNSPLRIISLLTPQTLNLAPGQTASLNLGTKVSSTANLTTYSVVVKGVSSTVPANVASVTANLQVQ